MNNCILMAEIVEAPQLRYTQDNQLAVSEMVVEFSGFRDEDPPERMKVVGWGNLAQDMQERYQVGDRVILEGRLGMNTVDRPEGFKEKRAELTVQKVHLLGAGTTLTTTAAEVAPTTATKPPAASAAAPATPAAKTSAPAKTSSRPSSAPRSSTAEAPAAKTPAYSAKPAAADPVDYDDIPF